MNRVDVRKFVDNKSLIRNVLICLLPIISCIVFRLLKLTGEQDMKFIMRITLSGIVAYGIYLAYKKQLTADKIVTLIIIAGCVIRIGYTLYTHAFIRGYDIGMNNSEGVGHWGYIYHVVNGSLPPSNEYQFYQPPLYYMVSAVFVRLMMLIKGANEWGGLEYVPQIVSCVCSVITLITVSKIMDELKINKRVQIIPMILLAVYPVQILAAGRMNNDSMVQMFMLLSLLYTLRWHKSGKMQDIVGIALSIGLGMMTKINCGIIAFITGPLMIYHLVKVIKKGDKSETKKIIIQFAVFAAICFPLGLWYGIRNYIEFGQPLNFVHELPMSPLYKGNDPWFERWITFPLFHLKDHPYAELTAENNILQILIKTGVHGEFTWESLSHLLAWTIEYAHIMLMMLTAYAIYFSFAKDKLLDKTQKFSALFVWALIAISYVQFNIAYPFSCTADFRYVLPAQIAGSFFISYFCDYCYANRAKKINKYGFGLCIIIVGVFSVMSIIRIC